MLISMNGAFAQFDLSKIGGMLKNIQSELDKSKVSPSQDNSASPSVPVNPQVNPQVNPNLVPISTKENSDSIISSSTVLSLEKELHFEKFCDKFKSIDAFSKLALTFKKADEDLGLPGYLSYSGSFPSELNWNPKALVSFTLNKLEISYGKKPFAADEFEINLAKSVQSCIANLRSNKDYRLFVLNGLLNDASEPGYAFKKWVLDTNKNGKFSNLFDAYDAFKISIAQQNKGRQEDAARRQPVVLGSDGLPIKPKMEIEATPKIQSMRLLFGNQGVRLADVAYDTPAFNGKPRMPVNWDQRDNVIVSKTVLVGTGNNSTSTLGVRLSLAALAVENGEKAISATYGDYLLSSIDNFENQIREVRERNARNKAESEKKELAAKLIANHPFRKEKISSCITTVDQLKKSKFPSYLNSDKLCTCGVDLSISELGWGVQQLDMLKTASLKKEKDFTIEENRVTKVMNSTFSMAIDECVKQQQPNN